MGRRLMAFLLTVSILFGMLSVSVSGTDIDVHADMEIDTDETGDSFQDATEDLDGSDVITRLQWLKKVTALFEMSVDEDNVPDNYFSDLAPEADGYYDMLLAVEFGLVDVEPGGEINPEGAVTRAFASHTLNFCLGFQLEEGATYSFSDVDSVVYPVDAQVAINRGWFELKDGTFAPEGTVTVAEADAMLADAKSVWDSTQIDENYENTYEFAEDVIVFPDTTLVEIDEDNVVTIYNCPETVEAGDTFAVFVNTLPSIFNATTVTVEGNKTTIVTSDADADEAIESIDAQGVIPCDEAYFTPAEGVTVTYTTESDPQQRAKKNVKCNFGKTVTLANGVTVGVNVSSTNLCIEYLAARNNGGSDYVALKGDVTVTSTAAVDFVKAAGESATVRLGSFGVPGVGEVALVVEVALKGSVTYTYKAYVCAGVEHSSSGFRTVTRFEKKEFSMCSEVEASIGLKLYANLNVLVFKGNIYARSGLTANLKTNSYTDGELPMACSTFTSWLYAEVGYSITCTVGKKDVLKKDITIYNYKNSPIQLYFHVEDGQYVHDCARNPGNWYTPATSRYGYYGSRNGSSTGVDSYGEPYTIFNYSLDENNNATITGYQGNVAALMIPETLDGYTVVAIGDNAFKGNTRLVCVVVPGTVTSIGDSSFFNCTALKTISLPDSVTSVGGYCFSNTGLSSLALPPNLVSLGNKVLENTAGVTELTIPKTVTYMGRSDYSGNFYSYGALANSYVEKLTFESGITEIPEFAASWDTKLTEVTIPDTVTTINKQAFEYCTGLSEMKIPGFVTTIADNTFKGCSGLTSINISDSVTKIGSLAFAGTGLTSLVLPPNLVSLGNKVLENTTGVTELTIPKTVTYMGRSDYSYNFDTYGALANSYVKKLTFESGITEIPEFAASWDTKLTEVTIPDTVTTIGDKAFEFCASLSAVQIPKSVTTFNSRTFAKTGLSSIVIPNSVQSMGNEIFKDCTSLTSVTLPNIRQNIMASMFEGCTALETITLPDTVTTIQDKAFKGCTALKTINWSKSLESIGDSAFYGCSALETVQVPDTVVTINNSAFRDCDALTSIVVPDSVTSFGDYMFQDSDALKDVTLGTGISEIKQYTFEHCDSLQSIVLPYRVATISDSAFKNCVALTEVTIPRATTSIASTAFSYPDKMTIYGVSGTYAETFANENGITFVNREINATEVSLSNTELRLNKGQSATLIMSVTPENFTDEVTWKSSNTSVATITDTGVVKAVGVGSSTIKLTVGSVSASCKVTVVQPVTSISLNASNLTLEALDTYQLTATVYPSDAYDKTYAWSSSDEKVATIDENGRVTAVAKGTATITVSALDGSNVARTCKVTVTNTAYVAETVEELESSHNYSVNCTDFWLYQIPGAQNLQVSFDERTEMEDGFDYLYIYDAQGNEIGKYTGTELAGATVNIPGDTVKIQIISDDSGTAWGFKVESVTSEEHEHTYIGEVTEAATCTEPGVMMYVCTCGDSYTETIPALGHSLTLTDAKAATCTEDGNNKYWTCKTCHKVFKDEAGTEETSVEAMTIEKLGHSWDDGVVTTQATCKNEGVTTYTCTVCEATKTESIPMTDHDYVGKPPVAATCTTPGYTAEYVCRVCQHATGGDMIPALGHSFTNYVYNNDAKVGVDGTETATCDRDGCHETDTRTAVGTALPAPTVTFTDVPSSAYYAPAVNWAVANNITAGTTPTTFSPDDTCTRAQVVAFLWRAAGRPEPETSSNPFTDVKTSDYFYKAVLWASENGIVYGTSSTTFSPNQGCTRGQVAAFLWRAAGRPEPTTGNSPFTDVKASAYYGKAVIWAAENKIVYGTSTTQFSPDASCTRAQIVTFLYRTYGK